MKPFPFVFLLLSFACAKQTQVADQPKPLSFEVSFDDSWSRIHTYKLSDDGKLSYFLLTLHTQDTVNFADTLMGEKAIVSPDLDSIGAILKKVIADSLGDKDLMCFDCGSGYLLYNEREYYVSKTSIPELFRIEKFVGADSVSNTRIDVGSYTTLQRLMPGE